MIILKSILFLINLGVVLLASSKQHKYAKLPEIYSYERRRQFRIDESSSSSSDSSRKSVSIKSSGSTKQKKFSVAPDLLEEFIETAVSGDSINWETLPESEMPHSNPSDQLSAYFTHINAPLFYGKDQEEKYGIIGDQVKRSFFAIYLRKYHWGTLDTTRPVKHVILIAGGPGESGRSWTSKLSKLSRQYGRSNLVFYVPDHRGVYKSRDVVELITRQSDKGQTRTSWRRIKRNEQFSERNWIANVREFEKQVGYPLVSMTCSNGARDLALISLVIRKNLARTDNKFYLHAQSYGTQLTTRTLTVLPDFYDGVLLEGLATMELVKETAKSDFGILSSCAEDRKCSQMFLKKSKSRDTISLSSPFDLKKLLGGMTRRSQNKQCRDTFLDLMRGYVYSETISFWEAIHLSFYELLTDDFINTYTGSKKDFYPGMLVLPLIRDMYYCEDVERFQRQVLKMIEVISVSIRGLKQPYVKTPAAKSKTADANQIRSHFVQTYINAHEAFDMQGMSRASERGYCDRPDQSDLVNQCPIWREQVRKMKILQDLTGTPDLMPGSKTEKPTVISKKTDKIDVFEGRYSDKPGDSTSSSTSVSTSTSSDDSGSFYKAIKSTIKLFTFSRDKPKRGNKKKKKQQGRNSSKNRKEKGRAKSSTGSESSEDKFEDISVEKQKQGKDKKHTTESKPQSKPKRKYHYDMESDELAYSIPSTEKTRIFVSVGSLDVKTPLLEARRFLARIRAPSKHLFELKNVAHSTDPCRAEIVHAMIADGVKEQIATLAAAEECVRELGRERKLDWQFEDVKSIPKGDWVVGI